MGKVFVYDHAKCNGCRNCQIACKDEHVDNAWPPYAEPQPDTGQFWCRIEEEVRGSVPKVKVSYTLRMCQHCDSAPCMDAAPGAVYKRDDGLVVVDPGKAKGMRGLVDACPYGAIFYNEELDIPQKCTGSEKQRLLCALGRKARKAACGRPSSTNRRLIEPTTTLPRSLPPGCHPARPRLAWLSSRPAPPKQPRPLRFEAQSRTKTMRADGESG
ncbi:4Fe-4S dicluster domain-containing protein [Raoultibacter timonensis]|uniref:4Fe-4S dicluster domain-containing protein n=1 Tax=Raoultibacter timonensis TaxID=1907662 RepID=UPI000C83936C|nr:4Fe-4S dicluster domain-containing protein [Raoultibacter timonensis]